MKTLVQLLIVAVLLLAVSNYLLEYQMKTEEIEKINTEVEIDLYQDNQMKPLEKPLQYIDTMTARIIYSEAGPTCSPFERLMVASAIKNRVNHVGFNKRGSMYEVVTDKKPIIQFSSYEDMLNSNWVESENPETFTGTRLNAWSQSLKLATKDFTPINSVVYFHDKSISKPRSWDNRYWKTFIIKETKHFIFYGIESKS